MPYPIIDEILGQTISWQGRLVNARDDACRPLFEPTDASMIYEVVRLEDGIPLFWEDHLARLKRSAGDHYTVPDTLYDECRALVRAAAAGPANLRLILTADQRVIHLIPSYYPDEATRLNGILTGLLEWEREDPNIKVIRSDYKTAVARRFAEGGPYGGYFELLLADRQGFLTEGSRSNLFFIQGDRVLSAPDSRILIGITRQYVTAAIKAAGAVLEEKMITFEDIRAGRVDAAFITGSPIDVLAVSAVEQIRLDSADHPLLQAIDEAYQRIVAEYICQRRDDKDPASCDL